MIVLGDPQWKPALLGLAANSLVGDGARVVCLWGRDGNGKVKGSCRSDGSLSVVDLFVAAKDAFVEYGGHHASGGFSLENDAVHTLPERLASAAEALTTRERTEVFDHEAELLLGALDAKLFREISRLAPFGIGNPKPVFRTRTRIASVRRFGKEKNHIELAVACADHGHEARAYDFFRSEVDFSSAVLPGMTAALFATLERDSFRGGYALRLVDIKAI